MQFVMHPVIGQLMSGRLVFCLVSGKVESIDGVVIIFEDPSDRDSHPCLVYKDLSGNETRQHLGGGNRFFLRGFARSSHYEK